MTPGQHRDSNLPCYIENCFCDISNNLVYCSGRNPIIPVDSWSTRRVCCIENCFCDLKNNEMTTKLLIIRAICLHRLAGLVVKASASGAQEPGFESRLRRDIFGSSHTSDFKIGTSVTTLPGDWHYRVSAGTGRPGVSVL